MRDKQRGALLGLAIGDALGAAVEFQRPGTFPKVTGYRKGSWPIPAGGFTDDTSMALAMADSIRQKGWDLKDQLDAYSMWYQQGEYSCINRCFDIGTQTRSGLSHYTKTGGTKAPETEAAGNGSIMRLAPVPIKYAHLFREDIMRLSRYAEESSATTHNSPMCVSACRYMALLMAAAMNGVSKSELLDTNWGAPLNKAIEEVARGSFKTCRPMGTGYVVKSLEASLWAFWSTDNFRDAVLAAVNLGDDSDTTGAVCGQIAGSYYGESRIPKEFIEGLYRRDMVENGLKDLGV